jgi:hypothetical protein
MEHSYIDEHDIADRYLSGKLSAEDRMRYEEHFIDCTLCLDRLEDAGDLRDGLRIIASENVAAIAGVTGLARFARLIRARRTALLACLIIAIALPASLLILDLRSMRRELAQAKQTSIELQRKYDEGEKTARERLNELSAQLEREREARSRLASAANESADSMASVPVFALSFARGGSNDSSQPVNRIAFPAASKSIILLLELDPNPEIQSYRAILSTADGRSIWRSSLLKPEIADALAFSISTSLLKPDNYLLTLEGRSVQGRYRSLAKYTFRALAQ